MLTDFDAAAEEALGYCRSLRPVELHAVFAGSLPRHEVASRWAVLSGDDSPIHIPGEKDHVSAVLRYVRALPRNHDDFVTVVIPEGFRKRSLLHALRRPVSFALKVRLLREPQVVVTDVPVLLGEGGVPGGGRAAVPHRTVAFVLVADVHDASLRAVRYARSLQAGETRAIYVSLEPEEELDDLLIRWAESEAGIPLDVVQAPFRDLGAPLLEEIRRVTAEPGVLAAVVMPEYLVSRWWHRALHNNRALFIKRLLLFEPRVVLSSVPYALDSPAPAREPARA